MQDRSGASGASLEPGPPRRLTEIVHRALFDRIHRGRYPLNTRLPSERELAIEFDVSRPIVRAALARLRQAGFVHSIKGSGTLVVQEPEADGRTGASTTVRDLQRCFEFRVLIEGEAAYFASIRASPAALASVRAAIEASEAARQGGAIKLGQSFDFHRAVAAASDNDFYVNALSDLAKFAAFRIYIGRSHHLPGEAVRLELVNAEHLHILDLIARRDAEEARAAMRVHIERARDNFMECLPLGGEMPELS